MPKLYWVDESAGAMRPALLADLTTLDGRLPRLQAEDLSSMLGALIREVDHRTLEVAVAEFLRRNPNYVIARPVRLVGSRND